MTKTNSKSDVQRLTGMAILAAIIIVLQVLVTVFTYQIPVLPFAITLALVPIVIGGANYGPKASAFLGAVFSVIVVLMCAFGLDKGGAMVWEANAFMCTVLCMVKGTAAGFAAGALYSVLKNKNKVLAVVAAAVVSPIVNTGLFIIGMLLFFKSTLNGWAGQTNIIYYAILIMAGTNFLIEMGVNVALSPTIVKIEEAVSKTKK